MAVIGQSLNSPEIVLAPVDARERSGVTKVIIDGSEDGGVYLTEVPMTLQGQLGDGKVWTIPMGSEVISIEVIV